MRMDFYRYREEVKRAILKRMARLDSEWDAFAASWLAYAVSQDRLEPNQPLLGLTARLTLWASENDIWSARRNLGAACFLGYLVDRGKEDILDFTDQVLQQIGRLHAEESHKFSVLNDPEQVFPVALLVGCLEEVPQNLKGFLQEAIRGRMQGTLKRQILYAAALRELGGAPPVPASVGDVNDAGDVVALVWYWERYGPSSDRTKWWAAFESIKDGLSLDQDEAREGARVLSVSEVALLYEAVARETANPAPDFLFEFYPLHPRVKEIARKPFREGNYVHAVFEAAKAFEEYLKKMTGIHKTCHPLVQESLGGKSPRVRFNRLQSESERNEQRGLCLIAEGVCAAFRNPKGHEPMDAPTMQIDAIEALDQLAVISYILKRIDEADVGQ